MKRMPSTGSMGGLGSDTDAGEQMAGAAGYHVKRSRLIGMINWWHVLTTFYPHILVGLFCCLASQVTYSLVTVGLSMPVLAAREVLEGLHPVVFGMGWRSTLLAVCLVYYLGRHHHPVYLVDFCVFDAPASWRLTHEELMECMRRQGCFNESSLSFLERILERSGTGPATAWPPGITRSLLKEGVKADQSVEAARAESEFVICETVKAVLAKTGTDPRDIDILIVNCSLFSPTPSLCALVLNRFKMRHDVMSYNLSGMGCSASPIAVELAQSILRSYPNKTALIVSTENLTQNLYHGNTRSMLLQNTLFRCGGAAILLSNRWRDGQRAKYKLLHVVRTQGTSDEAYNAVYECEDENGQRGVRLSKEIVNVAGRTMEENFTVLGPYVLPLSEQAKVVKAIAFRKLCKAVVRWCKLDAADAKSKKGFFGWLARVVPLKVPSYVPDFKRGIDHWCIHAGGRAVVDGVVNNLKLLPHHAAPSKHALYHHGNTSSSSIWYELDYVRKHAGQRRGHRVLQVAFGSGFKCNSAVWLCLGDDD
ncbi:FAE1/Type III polyketide synthase-like protein-domain-containing protein [Pelagophyceae sp. CCMP2097]|nr:FAE1/Type III polyketide synthase-like protein-domain-containing protein [Pelagophyceae sp. CCMP2097]|mmetsp:Transcript_16319/g.55068  ORF Transcript_16319/g.55068 Transcript_16319/m.55068 type:complete len:535 (+) Transcript_16319:132-1736(+)|eukprot:CAMPEP_0184092632 /NCGR_PEP_ID=MMETSP0974-20121125/8345_1 /TAXON_ID=483370 /ORGANISM="non described non described, Strain CCMP2097" /LENGTH=534 /DNA_ID=CAMNT_0026395391 /DNA_START=124 /DNA_END=1728 /DNA_ORIENTATION=+